MLLFEVTRIFSNNLEKPQCCSLAYCKVHRRAEGLRAPGGLRLRVALGLRRAHFGRNSPCCGVGAAPSLHSRISAGGEAQLDGKSKADRTAIKGISEAKNPELHPFKYHLPIFPSYPRTTYSTFIFKSIYFLSLNAFIQE